MQVSVVTSLFNRLDLTRACWASLRRTLDGWDYEWIVIDDGSTDDTRAFLETLAAETPRVRVVLNDRPRGFAANNNHGARLARTPLLCLLNNDTVLLPGWLEPMARAARLPDVAFVGNVQREPVTGLLDHCGVYFNALGFPMHAGKDEPAPPTEDYLAWPAVTAACCVIRRDLFLALGAFDEGFLNGLEDIDLCLRAWQQGYRHFVANRSEIYHYVSASAGREHRDQANLQRFWARWLGTIQQGLTERRSAAVAREVGQRYLRKHRWQPWRYNFWRLCRSLEQVWSTRPPSRRLDLVASLRFRLEDAFTARRAPATPPTLGQPRHPEVSSAAAPVFVVVGDTAQTADRSGVPTLVRSLTAAWGRLAAPVRPVVWSAASRTLRLLPPELSIGADAESLRPACVELGEDSLGLGDPALAQLPGRITLPPSLHELPAPFTPPPGAWIVLPEVLYQERTAQLLAYVRAHGWRLAVVLHDLLPVTHPADFPVYMPREHRLYARAAAGADLILPVSIAADESWRQFLDAEALPSVPTRLCAPGADTFARERAVDFPPRHSAAPVRMLCVSGVEPRKNHRTLLAAYEQILTHRPEVPLELVLVGMPRHFNEDNVPAFVDAFVERHPGKVRWTAWAEYSGLRKLYEECDFTVFPSVLEASAQPVLESLWFGRPCVCADFGAVAQVAAGGGCLSVDVRDLQVLSDAILLLATSPGRRAELTREAAARSLRTWEDNARDVLAALQT